MNPEHWADIDWDKGSIEEFKPFRGRHIYQHLVFLILTVVIFLIGYLTTVLLLGFFEKAIVQGFNEDLYITHRQYAFSVGWVLLTIYLTFGTTKALGGPVLNFIPWFIVPFLGQHLVINYFNPTNYVELTQSSFGYPTFYWEVGVQFLPTLFLIMVSWMSMNKWMEKNPKKVREWEYKHMPFPITEKGKAGQFPSSVGGDSP